ncbi:MAG: RdgB/HAM1 family non-canonical purine NTP pyrophosphatase [Pseudomonadota bacterium]|nr:RdgB/HAM1 family non-canonical purine NTP pyrophosphatase [Gammaproteobacteria bacterium]MBU1559040.1 RdgB/HAM1 family non-canonical purine NTP pyrophosphatase [Gammaproteobacteria bacterium]MBU1926982.1 RdgB/HAM1 family non-canonical purine NTP pyrophosphatase [Gammaproteobacteria bacterium]MBU2546125.1 RdgB/HAM1 family non-canonical purine NTP pyrophosphatase [Gammaproteobacteria bacterium]
MQKIVLASYNEGKLREFRQIFSTLNIQVLSQGEFNVPQAEETGLTFVENAIIKARQACRYSEYPAIGDDSGLEVDALSGKPGIYSARFAGPNVTQEEHINKLLEAMRDVPEEKRTARFCCVLAFMRHKEDPMPIVASGRWEGRILMESVGSNGFGYDPIFFVPDQNCSAACLSQEKKNQLSHRSRALRSLLEQMDLN